jgi:hypothetical protein
MLAASSSDVFFYDGPSLTVRRLSPDFQKEEILADDFICSPIAVSQQIFCGQVEGLFELSPQRKNPVALTGGRAGPISFIAASPTQVAWLVDTGANKLAVEMLPLPH